MNEEKRFEALKKLQILDTLPEQAYDDIVLLASQLVGSPIAIISLVDKNRIWFKAKIGTNLKQIASPGSFCDTAILNDQPLVVSDASQDRRFKDNELVQLGIRFYAGIPLIMQDGETVGNLCVLDTIPRTLSKIESDNLQVIARQVVREFERRISLFQLEETNLALEMAETKYRNLVQLSPAGIFQADAAGKFIFVSERWQKVAGMSMEEAINAGWENAVHPDDKEKIFNEWMTADAENRPFTCEYRLRTPDKKITWVNAESYQLRDANGNITGYIGALQDISNLKQSEDELRTIQAELENRVEERTADLRSLTESIPQLVWKISPSGESLYMSPNWTELTGVLINEAKWEDIIHPDDIPKSKNTWIECLSSGSHYEVEYRIKLKDGTYRWFLARGVPQLNPEGKVIKWFGTCTDIHAQKLAIENAYRAEQKLSQYLTSVPVILWATDINGIVTLSDGKGLASIGLKPGETVGWDMLNSPDIAAESSQHVKRALLGESFVAITNFAGHVLETQYAPLLDQNGMPSGMVAITNDITDKIQLEYALRKTEESARESARRLNAVLQNAPIALTEINRERVFTYSDGKYLSKLGIKPEELTGQSCFNLYNPDSEMFEILQRTFEGETVTAELQDTSSWVLSTTTPLTIVDGIVTSVLALSIDITDKMKAEASIRKSESKFKKVYDSKIFGMLFWDQDGAIQDTNDAFLELVGYSRDELNDGLLNWKELTPPEYAELDAKAVAETVTHGHCEPYEHEFNHKNGSRINIIISGASIQGEVNTGGIALVIDVSAKKKAEREKAESILNERAAVHASKTKSQFLANMSHEIRTPINGVLGMLTLLLDTPLQNEQREYADAARASAESLLTVINDILDFSKIEAGKLDFENIDFDLHSVLHNVERSFLYLTERKGLKLIFDFPKSLPQYLNGDSGRLRQILNNLISNAIKFTTKGQISVKVRTDEANSSIMRFEVKDSGIGISLSGLDKMFKPFSQADASTARRFGGTGLGLSISKHLVEQMNGEIGVETQENIGSTFWFTVSLKIADKPVGDSGGVLGSFADNSSRPIRVLIAEDNTINQKIALRYLEKMGLRADAVANGIEVLEALSTISYDLVLMDCQMPEMDGLEATRKIRASKHHNFQHIPIIAMTANAITGDRERCLESGMNDYVSKPVAPSELFSMLQKWFTKFNLIQIKQPQEIKSFSNSLILDQEIIAELFELDDDGEGVLIRELVRLFLIKVPISIAKMSDTESSDIFKKIAFEAHNIKSSSGNLGATKMTLIVKNLESSAIKNDKAAITSLLKDLQIAFDETSIELIKAIEVKLKKVA